MCGIAGILKVWTPEQREFALRTPHGQSIPEPWLDILDDSIKHRGPDGRGRFRDRAIRADGCIVDVALVHRRLSIIDHAGGHQPMVHLGTPALGTPVLRAGRLLNPSELERWNQRVALSAGSEDEPNTPGSEGRGTHDRIAVVFNGCIYNHRELRDELQKAGHVFCTDHSDTEVLVHGWREWGEEMPRRLNAMFGFAIWSSETGELLLSRDSFGEKPMYAATLVGSVAPGNTGGSGGSGVLAFANCPAALVRLQQATGTQTTDPYWPVAIADVTGLGCVPWVLSFAGVQQPSPGAVGIAPPRPINHYVPIFGGFQTIAFNAAATIRRQSKTVPPSDPAERVESLIESAVRRRLDADAPLACLLSGGVDSSIVALMATRHCRELATVCVRMPGARYDESHHAALVAERIGSKHLTVDVHANPAEDLLNLVRSLGHPFGDSSLLPTYWACCAAAEHAKVALAGDGGDELFLGYERYRVIGVLRWLRLLGPILWAVPTSSIQEKDPRSKVAKLARLLGAAKGRGYEDLISIFPIADRFKLFSSSIARRSGTDRRTNDPLVWEVFDHLPDMLLKKTDHASMCAHVELRAPLLDPDLAAQVLRWPKQVLMPRGQRKGLLRAVARKYLPSEIVDRPKMGFAIPIGEWFRSDYGGLRTMLLDHLNSTEPFGPPSLGIDLNMKFIRQMLDEHLGTGPSGQIKRDHSQRLYMLLVLSIWAKWIGGLR